MDRLKQRTDANSLVRARGGNADASPQREEVKMEEEEEKPKKKKKREKSPEVE
jgi:hypothetical protein